MIPILPRLVRDHRDGVRIPAGFLDRFEAAAQNRLDAERVEVIRGDDAAGGALRAIADGERGAEEPIGDEGLGEVGVPAQILEIRPGDSCARAAMDGRHRDHPVLIGHGREGAQQNSFDPTEDRCSRADSQRQTENGKEGNTRTAPQHPECEPQVLKHIDIVTHRTRDRNVCTKLTIAPARGLP